MSDAPQSDQPEAGAAQGLDLGVLDPVQQSVDHQPVESPNAPPAAAASSLAATDPEALPIPPDHPLAFLGGPFRYLVSHIVELEARLKKLEGG